MTPLNLPHYDFKVKKSEGKVWIVDGVRKKICGAHARGMGAGRIS